MAIDEETWGWGYLEDELGRFAFHLECFQIHEEITV